MKSVTGRCNAVVTVTSGGGGGTYSFDGPSQPAYELRLMTNNQADLRVAWFGKKPLRLLPLRKAWKIDAKKGEAIFGARLSEI
jgi:hypothetical protein